MFIFKKVEDLQLYLKDKKGVGFVPTMGALHQGHIYLIQEARQQSDLVVCSIYVNPTQFNNKEDFDKYPITINSDIALLHDGGCDVLFLPDTKEIYPDVMKQEAFELGNITKFLEGEKRPGHFDGVAKVVSRLLEIVQPQKMFLGLKDFQQVLVIKKLVQIKSLEVQIITCNTLREDTGLAMSSRNMRLSPDAKKEAVIIYKLMVEVKEKYYTNSIESLIENAVTNLEKHAEKVEYFVIRDADTLEEINSDTKNTIVLVAAWFGGVRLIDNMVLGVNN